MLRSATTSNLVIPRCRLSTYGTRAFSVAGPVCWHVLNPDRPGLSHSAALFQLFSPPLFLFSSFPPPFRSPFLLPLSPPRSGHAPIPFPSFLSLLFPFRPSISLISWTHYVQLEGLGERCELPQRGLKRSPSRNRIWFIFALKYHIWWQLF